MGLSALQDSQGDTHVRPTDVAIVGGGMAGLAAAWEANSRGLGAAVFESGLYGGLVANVARIDGWPAPIGGTELASAWRDGLKADVRFVEEHVTGLRRQGRRHIVETDRGRYRARAVILAAGAELKRLGVPGEMELAGRGVSQCAFCDAGFFRDRDVAVVGGGDAALQEALHLSAYVRSVALIVRGERLRARQAYAERAAADPKFRFHWKTRVARIEGAGAVEVVGFADGGRIDVDGVFVFPGVEPRIGLAGEGIALAGAVRGSGSVLEAMADGVRAARSVAVSLQAGA